jgi:hypothetical protein
VFNRRMVARYEVSRSHTDKELHVICLEGRFYDDVPPSILHLGPWTGGSRGEVSALKPGYRALLAAHGFVLVHQHLKDFRPEA